MRRMHRISNKILYVLLRLYIYIYILDPCAKAECDTRSVFKRSLKGLNSEIFLLLAWLPRQG